MTTPASLALVGGRVLSSAHDSGYARALAVCDGAIVAIGRDDEVAELVGPRTRVVDLRGRLVVPSFGDAHVHAANAALEGLRCNLLGLRTRDDCLDAIAAHCARLGPDEWVLGGGWSLDTFPGGPTAADLDAACAGRPAFLPNRDHHSAWVSTAAMRLAGVGPDTPDPFDGRVERDPGGAATGALHDGAMALVGRVVPRASPDELARAIDAAQSTLFALGVTHFQDACVGDAPELGVVDTYDAYRRAAESGALRARVVGALWWDRQRGVEQIDELLARRDAASEGQFRATSVKLMLDGVCETLTAAMSSPYLGTAPGHEHRGELFIEPDVVTEAVRVLDDAGAQVHFHAIGDRAISVALDAVAALPASRRGLGRHHVAHLQFIAPPDLARFRDLGVTANFQPLWACSDPQVDELTVPVVGDERADWQYSIGSVLATGARVAFGSDWPVSSPDPLQLMHVAVNRTLSERYGRAGTRECEVPLRASEAVSALDALSAFTTGVAYLNHDEDVVGELRVGRRADAAVLDQDVLAIESRRIGETSVDLTLAGGDVVFERA